MSKKKHFKSRGPHFELPIIDYVLAELRLNVDRACALIFRSDNKEEARLEIEEAITLSRGQTADRLEGSRPGTTFAPQTLEPLVQLLGSSVTDAIAQKDGEIRIELSNAMTLSVIPTHGYEGWHFHCESKSDNSPPLTLHGATGHLI